MFNKKQVELIEFLYMQGSASSNILASQLKISKRTVISYVKDINRDHPEKNLILSSNRGYSIDQDVFNEIKDELPDLTDNDADERLELILRLFLSGYSDKINMFEISEELHYSESTIRSTLYKIKNIVREYDLDIQLSYNSAILTGPEERKRELYFSLFQDAIERNLYDFSRLYAFLPQYVTERIYKTFESILHECYNGVCDYEEVSLYYRLLIAMDRISHGHFVVNEPYIKFAREEDMVLGQRIASEVGNIAGVDFPEIEVRYLVEVFTATCIYGRMITNMTPDDLKDILWPECYELVEECADDISKLYDIDIREDENDYVAFAMHVRALIRRLNSGVRIRNPYLRRVKRECVAAYDCAVYVSGKIHKLYPVKIWEDDIADLSLCLGRAFEKKFDDSAKIKVLFVLPSYYNIHENLYDYYKEEFENKIQPDRTSDISTYKDLDKVDIVVSTLSLKDLGGKLFLRIRPIRNADDTNRLEEMCNKIHHDKMVRSIQDLIRTMGSNERFYNCPDGINDMRSAIDLMTAPLIEKGIVGEDFKDFVLEREQLASSGVDMIAAPSVPQYFAKEDTMSFLIMKKPVDWAGREVGAVLLFTSVEGHYQSRCMRVLRRLLHVMGRRDTAKKMFQCCTFEEFGNLFM